VELDIVKGSTPPKWKKKFASGVTARNVGAFANLGSLAPQIGIKPDHEKPGSPGTMDVGAAGPGEVTTGKSKSRQDKKKHNPRNINGGTRSKVPHMPIAKQRLDKHLQMETDSG
jgi:hypothetical protein